MANPFIGEIRMFGGNFAPQDWAFCNGQLMQISDNTALFNLLGTTYGGDGQSTFGLPNLQGRLPVDQGSGTIMGQVDGSETITLVTNQLPSHNHPFNATDGMAGTASPSGALPANGNTVYSATTPSVALNPQSIGQSGGNQSHANMMPFLAVSFIISLYGIYPTQS